MPSISFPSWRDQAREILYPFVDGMTLSNGEVAIPKDLFVDLSVFAPGVSCPVFISEIEVSSQGSVLKFSDSGGSLCNLNVDHIVSGSSAEVVTKNLVSTRSGVNHVGVALLNKIGMAQFATWPHGQHYFSRYQTMVLPDIVLPSPESGIRGFVLENGDIHSGDVVLYGEDGITFRVQGGALKVDAIGDPTFLRKQCDEEQGDFDGGPFLKTINNIAPDNRGNFIFSINTNVVPDTLLRMMPEGSHAIRVRFATVQR